MEIGISVRCTAYNATVLNWRIQRGGGNLTMAPQSPGRRSSCLLALQKLPKSFYFYFFESEFGSIPKNSGLTPWNFQFLGYPRLEPRARFPPPPSLKPAAGSASAVFSRIYATILVKCKRLFLNALISPAGPLYDLLRYRAIGVRRTVFEDRATL